MTITSDTKRLIASRLGYSEYLVLPDDFPNDALIMLLGAKHIVKGEYSSEVGGVQFIPPSTPRSPSEPIFDINIVPATCVPLPDLSDPKDLAIYELGERCKELERKLKRKV